MHFNVEAFAQWVVRHRAIIVITCVTVCLGLGLGLKNWEITGDYRVFFPPNNPYLLEYDRQLETFSENSNIYVAVTNANGDVFNSDTLAMVEEMTDRGWELPYSIRVDSLSNFPHSKAVEDDLYVASLVESANEYDEQKLQEVKSIALAEKRLLGKLVSNEGTVTAINYTFALPDDNEDAARDEVIEAVSLLIEEFRERYPGHEFYKTGDLIIDQAFLLAPTLDARSVYPLGVATTIFLLLIILRNVTATLVAFTVVILSVFAGIGAVCWSEIKLTPIITCTPVMILILGLADCIHILVIYFQGLSRGKNKEQAMVESLVVNFRPVVLTSVTTAVSFFALMISEVQPYKVLGLMVGIGVLFAMCMSLTLMPAIATLFPMKHNSALDKFPKVQGYTHWLLKYSRRIVVLFAAGSAILIGCVTLNETNDDLLKFFRPSMEVRGHSEFVTQNITGVLALDLAVPAIEAGGIVEPEYLNTLDQFVSWVEGLPQVAHVNSFSDIIKELNKNMHGDDLQYYRIPDDRELASQYLLLYELSLPMGLDLTNQINTERSQTLVSLTLNQISNSELIEFEVLIRDWFNENAPVYMQPSATSGDLMFAHVTRKNTETLIVGFVAALVIISLLISIMLRSVKLGLFSLITNSIPATMAFGFWGIINGYVSMGIATAFTMTLGLVVDDTIHFLSKYTHAREQGKSTREAIEYAFNTVGIAMIITSVILVVGFATLALSVFGPNMDAGLMSSATISFALLTVFLLLPVMLWLTDKKHEAVLVEDKSVKSATI